MKKIPDERSLTHMNGHLLCAIDCETTGLNPVENEIIQICILPLNSNFTPYKKYPPFYIRMKPLNTRSIDFQALAINDTKIMDLMKTGIDPDFAATMLDEWFQKLNLPFRKKLSPLAHNWAFDRDFIKNWLGPTSFEDFFDFRVRDTMQLATYLNDVADYKCEEYPFPKQGLSYMCNKLKIEHEFMHDALQDCLLTAQVYQRMVKMGFV